jgi:hypothetical protein
VPDSSAADPRGASAPDPGHCDSCGRDDEDDVIAVHRVYVTPESWDTQERIEVVDEIEHWCFVCRSHYPHQVVGAEDLEL